MCGRNPMRVIGGALAIVYVSLGLSFFVVGFVLQVAPASSMMKYIQPYVNRLNMLLAPASAQFDPYIYIDALPKVTGNIAAAFIAMGAVQTLMGLIGIAALCGGKRRPILTAFFVFMVGMIVCQVALIVLYYALRMPISSQAKVTMQSAIRDKYTDYNVTNMETILINVFHVSLSCCGVNGGSDFDSATNWPRSVTYNGKYYYPIARPLTCCKTTNYAACLMTNHTDLTYTNQDKGCWSEIQNTVDTEMVYAALATGALILLEVLLLAFSASVCYTGRMKPKKLDDSEQQHM